MTKPFREGSGWAFRLRERGQDIYKSGYPTQTSAQQTLTKLRAELRGADKAVGRGPFKTTVAQAFMQYARDRLPFLKGAKSDVLIINRYLRAARLQVVQLSAAEDSTTTLGQPSKKYWKVSFVREDLRIIPNGLAKYRKKQEIQCREADTVRRKLATMFMADVTGNDVQALLDARMAGGYRAATIANERSELRRLFNHAAKQWNWTRPARNPASGVNVPAPEDPRDFVVSNAQWENLSLALCQAGNEYAPSLFCLMLETAMRSGEALTIARWSHISWERYILSLPDAKAGGRDVPLSEGAVDILKQLQAHAKSKFGASWSINDRIFPTTYEAIKKAWAVARRICNEGGTPIGDLRIHDLRHTAATRYALQFKGNMPVIKRITGHKTTVMAARYIHIKADTVAHMMRGEEPAVADSPAGYRADTVAALARAQLSLKARSAAKSVGLSHPLHCTLPDNVVALRGPRSAA